MPKEEIAAQGCDLSLNRTKDLVDEEVEHLPPLEILAELRAIAQEIPQGIEGLEGIGEVALAVAGSAQTGQAGGGIKVRLACIDGPETAKSP